MTIRALPKVATGQNGVGSFVLQCKKMDIHYCDYSGSSKGMGPFIRNQLRKFAAENPQIEFNLSPRPRKHPVLIGHYINGHQKSICVRNLDSLQVLQKARLLRDDSGEKVRRVNKPVQSIAESVRGVWSPYHGHGDAV